MTWCNKFGIHYLFDNILILLLSILISCMVLYEHYCLHLLHYTWLKCIRSYTKDLNYEFFFANRWLFHNWFISLDNPLEVIVHHLLIGGMTGFGNQDGFPMVSALLCIVTHWIGTTVIHDLRLSSSHHLLIGGMTGFGYQDGLPMVSALVRIVTHWIGLQWVMT